jgi:hypothetical protein
MKWLFLLGLGFWALFGSPKKDVANWFWSDQAAPWETVDAFYYPNRSDLSRDQRASGLASVDACRTWVDHVSRAHNDVGITRGDYECGVGYLDDFAGMRVYRTTVR